MRDDEWLLETDPPKKTQTVGLDRRPFSERSSLVDHGLVDFRRICSEMGILDPETDTIQTRSGTHILHDEIVTLRQVLKGVLRQD